MTELDGVLTGDPQAKLEEAIALAVRAHMGQRYSFGGAYIVHPLALMQRALKDTGSSYLAIVAVLHDVVEDTFVDLATIHFDFGGDVAEDVDALTRREGETYEESIERVALNPRARLVKLMDLSYNLDLTKTQPLAPLERQLKLIDRYTNAVLRLMRVPQAVV